MEPTARLVHCLGDKLRGEVAQEKLFVFKGIVILRKRHCARVKPAVEHFRHALHRFAAFRAFYRYLIDIRAVKLNRLCAFVAAHFIELLATADAVAVTAFAFPYIERRAPVAVARYRPVLNIFEPVSESSCADGFGNPVYGRIVAEQVFFYGTLADIP